MMDYPFSEAELKAAARDWGCNCGPSALAFAIQRPLEVARHAIPDFDRKRYTSPSMMLAALQSLGIKHHAHPTTLKVEASMFDDRPALVRVQWTGPWTGKWAYWYTHWVCCWKEWGVDAVFDCNGGVLHFREWRDEIVPLLLPKRGDGKWHPTHIWRLSPLTPARGGGA